MNKKEIMLKNKISEEFPDIKIKAEITCSSTKKQEARSD
jgi:hypothetical protein